MAKTTDAERQRHYEEVIKKYEEGIQAFLKEEGEVLAKCRQDPANAACKLFRLAESAANAASYYLVINALSSVILDAKNEDALGEARKSISKAIIYIENIVTNKNNAPFSEYEESLAELNEISAEKKFYMVRKLGLALDILKFAFGDASRWKWAFVEIEGRFAVIAKNLLDLRKAQINDSRQEDHIPVARHLKLVKQLLDKSATRYIERYELSTKNTDDIQNAVNFISSLERLKIILNDYESMDVIRKKLDTWRIMQDTAQKSVSIQGKI